MTRFMKISAGFCTVALLLVPRSVVAHCDTYSGPVVAAAKQSLDKGNVTPVLNGSKRKTKS